MITKYKFSVLLSAILLSVCCISMTACTSRYQQESTGEYLDSSVITTKVKAKLMADDFLPGAMISVATYKNTVVLSGFVNNTAQKARAVRLAKSVPGVVNVKDSLEIKQ